MSRQRSLPATACAANCAVWLETPKKTQGYCFVFFFKKRVPFGGANVAPGSCVQSRSTQGLRPLAGMDMPLAAVPEAAGQEACGMQHLVALRCCFPKP